MKSAPIFLFCGLFFVQSATSFALTVASYNLQNYLSTGRMVDGAYRRDYPKPEAEKRSLRANIIDVNPDILAVQEMGDLPYLEELQRDLARDGLTYPYAYLGVGVDSVRHTAVLSKIEPTEVRKHLDLRFKYFDGESSPQRGLLELKFASSEEMPAFSLYVVHLKSKRTVRDDDFESSILREKEARVIRDRILKTHGEGDDAFYMVVGDFNDTKNQAPIRRFLEIGGRDIGTLLPLQDEDGYWWTYYWERAHQYSRVDYIVCSPAFMSQWTGESGIHPSVEGSDHRLLWAMFE
ncbi:MAG: endonuclease/exonuclease/phosphatase family protein [Opitutales bacterium]